ncbi:MAG: SAM-dependent chlorinase/fluorinase [Chloroflexi bacterium]|nr:SAM-dependent chlorinase/fluorinase [Chloroflexota bacterium]
MPGRVVTLLTDFGNSDAYPAQMKGVILGLNPGVTLVDLTHEVPPQDVLAGAFLLGSSWPYFPEGTTHVAVVDPGVGTDRKALLLLAHGHTFLAPDNGLLSYLLPAEKRPRTPFQVYPRPLPQDLQAYAITNARYWRHPVSATFHGRDVFAPAAAHLSLGVAAQELGEPVETILCFHIPVPQWRGRELLGHVIHTDRFGNVVTNVGADLLAGKEARLVVEIAGATIRGLSDTYAAAEGLAALIGSHGYLEVAARNGNAARELGATVGQRATVRLCELPGDRRS